MICILALVVFSVLGVFSIKYRKLATEAFDCVFRRVTLRPCETGFDQRMRAKILGKLLVRSPGTAKMVKQHFELISWTFTIIMLASLVLTATSVYNLAAYGNCDGPEGGDCIFTPVAVPEGEACDCGADLNSCKGDWKSCSGNCECVREACKT